MKIISNMEKCVQKNLSKKSAESIPLNRFQLFCHIHRNYWQKHFRSILCNMDDHLSERNDDRQENHHNDDKTFSQLSSAQYSVDAHKRLKEV